MLPSLTELGFESPSYLRKINNRTHWHPQEGDNNLTIRAQLAAEKLFNEQNSLYSLWYISNKDQFYCVVASLTANANPRDRNIDFILIGESELNDVNISLSNSPEGDCLNVQHLHFNALINLIAAQNLCYNLMDKGREAQRCKKQQTKLILEYKHQLGCKAVNKSSLVCQCEEC